MQPLYNKKINDRRYKKKQSTAADTSTDSGARAVGSVVVDTYEAATINIQKKQ
jgi:hypothetical protein